MAETIAKERWEIAISGKGRLAEQELAKEGAVNIHIHCRSLEEVCIIYFHCIPVTTNPPSPLIADEGRSNARCFRGEWLVASRG